MLFGQIRTTTKENKTNEYRNITRPNLRQQQYCITLFGQRNYKIK